MRQQFVTCRAARRRLGVPPVVASSEMAVVCRTSRQAALDPRRDPHWAGRERIPLDGSASIELPVSSGWTTTSGDVWLFVH
jgi:hypothetical protein